MRRTTWIVGLALVVTLLLAPVPLLAEEGADAHGEAHGFNLANFLFKCLNFAIFFGALGYFLAKPLSGFLTSRSETITKELNEARGQRDKAQAELETVKQQVADLQQEMEEIKSRATSDAGEQAAAIIEQAKAECKRIEEKTEKDLETMGKRSRQELREHAAKISIETAEKLIREHINDEDRRRILAASLERVGG